MNSYIPTDGMGYLLALVCVFFFLNGAWEKMAGGDYGGGLILGLFALAILFVGTRAE